MIDIIYAARLKVLYIYIYIISAFNLFHVYFL